MLFITVKNNCKLVEIWQSCCQIVQCSFFESRCMFRIRRRCYM